MKKRRCNAFMEEKRDFTPEEIQQAANEARHRGFGDFMFMDPNRHRGTSGSRTSSSTRRTSSSKRTSRKNTTRRSGHHHLCCSEWRTTARGRHQTMSCWEDSNMWLFKRRRR
ncbi:CotG/ExsB N-terminal domain-containing protein [Bacillus rubiinfantis]|uniref:CotG/ExsB N-terminal domain-containing protein n=1 Tax=Bacillus rubiinfantis TaxID=1499680 RepID=UPI003CCC8377